MPLTAELAGLQRSAAPVAMAAGDTARAAPATLRAALPAVTSRYQALTEKMAAAREAAPVGDDALRFVDEIDDAATPGTRASGGAAGTDMAMQRRQVAEDLLGPGTGLTKGQATRDPAQLKFEVVTPIVSAHQPTAVISLNCDAAQGSITGHAARACDLEFTRCVFAPELEPTG